MTKLDHVNITVKNLDESIQWYNELFGFERVEGGISARGSRWAIVACNDSMIAMTEFKDWKPADQNAAPSTHRLFHFGLRIDNADEWRAKIERFGLELHYGGEIAYPHSRSWYVHDPSGHEIEVSWSNGEALKFPEGR